MNTGHDKLTEVMSALYGPYATQMMGGNATRRGEQLHGAKNAVKAGLKNGAQIKGGSESKTKSDNGYEECAYPEYITHPDFQRYIHEFYLVKRICHSYSASLYVIPPKDKLDEMIKEFKDTLKKEKIEEGTAEAFQYSAIHDLPYKRCIFSVFADSDAAHYKLDNSAPYKEFGTVKRTNLLSEQFFFKYKSDKEVLICPDEKTDKGATTVKLIAKCLNGIYVFQGDIPGAKLTYEKKFKTKAFIGGSLKYNSLVKFNHLKSYLTKFGENGAERFIAASVKANPNNMRLYTKLFSGDLLHSAFRICFNSGISEDVSEPTATEARNITKQLIKKYKPNDKPIDAVKSMRIVQKLYAVNVAKSLNPKEASKEYVNSLKHLYEKCGKDMLYADVAVNLYRSHDYSDLQDIYNLVENVESVDNDLYGDVSDVVHLEFSDTSTKAYKTSKLCNYINQALSIAPLVGINAKSYYPQLQSIDTVRKSYTLSGGYFENVYGIAGGDDESEPQAQDDKTEDDTQTQLDDTDDVQASSNDVQDNTSDDMGSSAGNDSQVDTTEPTSEAPVSEPAPVSYGPSVDELASFI